MIPSRSWLMVGTPTPLKNHGVQVRLDDDIPNDIGENNKMSTKSPTSADNSVL